MATFDNVKPQLLLHQSKRRNVWKLTKFSKRNKSTVHKLENISSRINSKNLVSRHFITILLKAKNKQTKMLKTRTSNNFYRKTFFEWKQISHQKMEAKRKWQIFQVLKEKNDHYQKKKKRKERSTCSHIPTKNIFQEWKKNQDIIRWG